MRERERRRERAELGKRRVTTCNELRFSGGSRDVDDEDDGRERERRKRGEFID